MKKLSRSVMRKNFREIKSLSGRLGLSYTKLIQSLRQDEFQNFIVVVLCRSAGNDSKVRRVDRQWNNLKSNHTDLEYIETSKRCTHLKSDNESWTSGDSDFLLSKCA